ESNTKGPHLLTGQVLRLTAGRSELRQQPLSAALDKLLHHRRQPFLFGPLSLPLGAARCLLRPAILPSLRRQIPLLRLPSALLRQVNNSADANRPALAAAPDRASIARFIPRPCCTPVVPIRKGRLAKLGLNSHRHLDPCIAIIRADMGQQAR